ncbi:glycoprotein H [Cricetid gammaherpesvirus 2]|uniref:Glycoprotein H n=1 Tax=Cricetid gammaherpesvirus 2 TaxID=1605972 RepID=E9M5K5_9GAMA|nr:glycoprotein H [Cricetid gammaherpesvirus 2]ADW24363.1 glycoprotein H [Cricetid gammaherpesvirus 2]ADW24445.1 glycoprotein H [Cricetid gammaherpesvirus 2]
MAPRCVFFVVLFVGACFIGILGNKKAAKKGMKPELNTTRLDSVKVSFEGVAETFTVNWTKLVKDVGEQNLDKMWKDADVFGTLTSTLEASKDLISTNNTQVLNEDPKFICPTGQTFPGISLTDPSKKIHGFLGKAGMSKEELISNLWHNASGSVKLHEKGTVFMGNVKYKLFGKFTWKVLSNITFEGFVTEKMAVVTVNGKSKQKQCKMVVLFGYADAMPSLKGFLRPHKLEFSRTSTYSMHYIASHKSTSGCPSLVLSEPHIQHMFSVLTSNLPETVLEDVSDDIAYLNAVSCNFKAIQGPRLLSTFVKTVTAHFLFLSGLQLSQKSIEVGCVIEIMAELQSIREHLTTCGMKSNADPFVPTSIKRVAAGQIDNLPSDPQTYAPYDQTHRTLSVIKFGMSQHIGSKEAVTYMEFLMENIYRRYSHTYMLGLEDRRVLRDVAEALTFVVRPWNVASSKLLKLFAIATSMCSNFEIATMVARHDPLDTLSAIATFSPCYLSLRFDFSPNKVNLETMQTSDMDTRQVMGGVSGFLADIHSRHLKVLQTLPFIQCLKPIIDEIDVILPLGNITYVISREPVEGTTVYDISETFLESRMEISVITGNCEIPSHIEEEHKTVNIVYNVSNTRCKFCNSIIVSYDESQGFLSAMYILDNTIQNSLFLPESPFFDAYNSHVHYLWLMSNGTVAEIRGTYRRRAESFMILFAVIAILVIVSAMLIKFIQYMLNG